MTDDKKLLNGLQYDEGVKIISRTVERNGEIIHEIGLKRRIGEPKKRR